MRKYLAFMAMLSTLLAISGCVEEKAKASQARAKVDGQVYLEDSQVSVPNATVTVSCDPNGNREETRTDERGYYKAYIDCGYGSGIHVLAEAAPGELCLRDKCVAFEGGSREVAYQISSSGFAGVKVPLRED